MWSRLMQPPNMRLRMMVVAIGFVLIGGLGACISAFGLAPQLRAASGGGVTGTFTLTEPFGCDRYEPPRQRCGWFGDFRGDDGKTVRHDMELVGGLPPGHQVGDTVPARDTGSPVQVYRLDDRQSWRQTAGFLAAFAAAFLLGLAALRPWSWWARRRRAPTTT